MAIYKALGDHLTKNAGTRIPMTFKEVEAVIGRKLPASAFRHRPWWANEERGHSHAKAWLTAGYETEQVDMAARKLVFRRASPAKPPKGMKESDRMFKHAEENPSGRHPLIGAMKGTFSIEPGYDLTSPMYSDQEWAEIEKEMDEDWDVIEQGLLQSRK
jgi:hypothetical protein